VKKSVPTFSLSEELLSIGLILNDSVKNTYIESLKSIIEEELESFLLMLEEVQKENEPFVIYGYRIINEYSNETILELKSKYFISKAEFSKYAESNYFDNKEFDLRFFKEESIEKYNELYAKVKGKRDMHFYRFKHSNPMYTLHIKLYDFFENGGFKNGTWQNINGES